MQKKILELVQVLDMRRRRANFISDEAKFAAVCGRYGENFNEVRNKICLMGPRIQNLNKLLWFALTLMMASTLQVKAQYSKTDSTYKRWFVGSTFFLVGNLAPVNPPDFAQLNLGYRITGTDVISLELITWKYAWPLGINPFLNKSYGKPEEKFPGYIRDYGIALAYQRFFWKGLYVAVHVMPMWQTFVNDNGNKVDNGFHIFNTYRVGYHIKLFKDRFFIQPSLGVAGRPYHTKMPDGFKQKDDKWSKFTPEPGLHFGFNF